MKNVGQIDNIIIDTYHEFNSQKQKKRKPIGTW